MNTIIDAIVGTPWWVWLLFFYLMFKGIRATRTRAVYIPKLFIVPTILIALKCQTVLSFAASNKFYLLPYFTFISIGFFLGEISVKDTDIKIVKNSMLVELAGSKATLIILLLFFCMKYIFGYIEATNPNPANQILESLFNALFSGYFLGKSYYIYRFYKTSLDPVNGLKS